MPARNQIFAKPAMQGAVFSHSFIAMMSLRMGFLLATTAIHGRILQGDEEEEEYTDDDTTSSTNQYTELLNEFNERIESDVSGMWDSAPSAWELEYWEVFGIVVLIVFGILLFFVFCCCCCTGNNGNQNGGDVHAGDRRVATHSELAEYRKHQLQEPILETTASSIDPTDEYSPAITATTSTQEDGILKSTTSTSTTIPKKRNVGFFNKTAFVWKETISVWGEFLGCSTADEEKDSYYKEYKTMKKKSKRNKEIV